MGVAEHVFDLNIHGKAVSWHLFDVGGARGQRHSWVPYFDDANAIIFVAPVSAFDQASQRSIFIIIPVGDICTCDNCTRLSVGMSIFGVTMLIENFI
jgi:hypothetical protein